MIREVRFDTRPIHPGEKRPLQAWADTSMSVAIKCFVKSPPPPGYRPCPACGVITLESGETTYVEADRATFEKAKEDSRLDVTLKDQTGDQRDYQLRVVVERQAPESEPVEAGA